MPKRPSPNQLCLPLLPRENSDPISPPTREASRSRKRKSPALERFTSPAKSGEAVKEHYVPEPRHHPLTAPAPKAEDLAEEQVPSVEPSEAGQPPTVDTQPKDVEIKKRRAFLQRIWGRLAAFLIAALCLLWSYWPALIRNIEGIKAGVDLWGVVRDVVHIRRTAPTEQDNKQDMNSRKTEWQTTVSPHRSDKK